MKKSENIQNKIGDVIRQLRISKGLSQEELSEKAGLHRTYIGSIERGERNVSLQNIARICKALGIKISELFEKANL